MKLSVRKVRELSDPGRYADGNGLYLYIRGGGTKQWVLRTVVQGKRSDIGLGSANIITLSEAREEAGRLRKLARTGEDPLAERQKQANVPTFHEAAHIVWEQHKPTWKNQKHAAQWINTLTEYACPVIGEMRIDQPTSAHILEILTPIWTTKPETASRVRQRLRAVFDWAKASRHRQGDNPVDGVKLALPKQTAKVRHHPALRWEELPDFMRNLQNRDAISAKALTLLILTANRSDVIRSAVWSEFDGAVWTVPAERMKMEREHRVPLSSQAITNIDQMRGFSDDLVFPGPRPGKPLSDMVFKALFKRMGYDTITAHGFRSTFRDWVSDNAVAPREVAEAALAHQLGDETERAYARSDLFERRRKLMQTWADYAYSKV